MSPLLAGFSVLSRRTRRSPRAVRGADRMLGRSGVRQSDDGSSRSWPVQDACRCQAASAGSGCCRHRVPSDEGGSRRRALRGFHRCRASGAGARVLRAREPALRTAAAPGPTGPARGRRSAGLLRRVAVLLRRGAQACPVGRLGRDRCCAGGPDPRRGVVANVYRPEPPCRSPPFDEQSGLRRHLRNFCGTAPRLRSSPG